MTDGNEFLVSLLAILPPPPSLLSAMARRFFERCSRFSAHGSLQLVFVWRWRFGGLLLGESPRCLRCGVASGLCAKHKHLWVELHCKRILSEDGLGVVISAKARV